MTKQSELVLGTAQIGATYGAANPNGMPFESQAVELIRKAIQSGVRCIDTARAYGDAERRVGLALASMPKAGVTVVTKLDTLSHVPKDASTNAAVTSARSSIDASRRALQCKKLDIVLLHRASHRLWWNGAVWNFLIDERDAGRIGRIGVSVQSQEEALAALADDNTEHVQLPFNVLDYRWEKAIIASRSRPDVVIHVRSVFLQGLLLGRPETRWPQLEGILPNEILGSLRKLTVQLGRKSITDLCMAYVRAHDWIDGIVVGLDNVFQLAEDIALFQCKPLGKNEAFAVRSNVCRVPESLLDPAAWHTV